MLGVLLDLDYGFGSVENHYWRANIFKSLTVASIFLRNVASVAEVVCTLLRGAEGCFREFQGSGRLREIGLFHNGYPTRTAHK
jgi:hypothetical protein